MKEVFYIKKVVLSKKLGLYDMTVIEGSEEFDFIFVDIPDNRNHFQRFKDIIKLKDKSSTVNQFIGYYGLWIPVKKPHEFKKGDLVEIELILRPVLYQQNIGNDNIK